MITEYLYDFISKVFFTDFIDLGKAMEFLPSCLSAIICTLPVYFLLRFLTNAKTSNAVYIALQVAFFALQAYSLNGGIL